MPSGRWPRAARPRPRGLPGASVLTSVLAPALGQGVPQATTVSAVDLRKDGVQPPGLRLGPLSRTRLEPAPSPRAPPRQRGWRWASLLPAAHVRASGARAASRSVPRAPSRALAFPVARDRSRSRHLPAALATRPRAPRQFSPAPRRGPSPVPGSRQGASRSLDCSLRELGVPTHHPVAQKAARVPHARCPRCLHPDPGPRAPGPRWFWARPGT